MYKMLGVSMKIELLSLTVTDKLFPFLNVEEWPAKFLCPLV